MHELAVGLNETLKGTCAYDLLSDYGLRMYVPKGIIVQSAEAKQKATRFNATIGVALENDFTLYEFFQTDGSQEEMERGYVCQEPSA